MSTTPVRTGPREALGLRGLTARHPVAVFTALALAVGWPIISVPALASHGLIPGGELPQEPFALGTLVLAMLPAALWVVTVADGPDGRRALLRRAFQWRFGGGWWIVAAVAVPALTLALGLATGGRIATDDVAGALVGGTVSFLTALLIVHVWEELVWAGFVQTTLERRHGLVVAAVLTAIPFAAIHVPLQLIGDLTASSVLVSVLALFGFAVVMRLGVGLVLRGTAASVLAAGVFHASFNASANEDGLVDRLLDDAWAATDVLAPLATMILVGVLAMVLRGRSAG
jgi:membrane protease YdiL (CAAX protease family)